MVKRGRSVPPIELTAQERDQLESYVRSRSIPSGLSRRFKIVLLAADHARSTRALTRILQLDFIKIPV